MSTEFQNHLSDVFGKDTLKQVCATFKQLNIPEPVEDDEFRVGAEGLLIFSNEHAVSIKIERITPRIYGERLSHENILQPIFQQKAGQVMLEIYPGITLENVSDSDTLELTLHLNKEGIHYWDYATRNTGRIPGCTVDFPKGVPVVIDRLSVAILETAKALKEPLGRIFYEDKTQAHTEQYKLYSPLYQAFKKAFVSNDNNYIAVNQAWQLCTEFKEKGKTIAGWMSDTPAVTDIHPLLDGTSFSNGVQSASINYTKRLKGAKK